MAAAMPPVTNIYLIGKQGCGKSATGNTLLGRKGFPAKASSDAVTTKIQREAINNYNHQIYIWDGPGINEMTSQTDETVNWLKTTINTRQSERHAILWVARYGELCGQEDEYLLKELNKKLGKTFLKNNTVIVITHTDNFNSDVEDSGLTFDDWVKQQTGFFKKMSSLVGSRVLPINNRSKAKDQVEQVFRCVLNYQVSSAAASDPEFDFEMVDAPPKMPKPARDLPTLPILSRAPMKQTPSSPYNRPIKPHSGRDAAMNVVMKVEHQGGGDVITKVKQQVNVLTNILSATSCQSKLVALEKVRDELNACSSIPNEKRDLTEAIIREVDREIEMCRSNIAHDQQTRDYLARAMHLLQSTTHNSAH